MNDQTTKRVVQVVLHELLIDHNPPPNNLFTNVLLELGLTPDQVKRVWETKYAVCDQCWECPAGCQCWNDE